jgi:hypothetical protein
MKNQSGEPSTQQRATQLQMKLEQLTKQVNNAKSDEQMKLQEVSDLKSKVANLKGQNDAIKK